MVRGGQIEQVQFIIAGVANRELVNIAHTGFRRNRTRLSDWGERAEAQYKARDSTYLRSQAGNDNVCAQPQKSVARHRAARHSLLNKFREILPSCC